MKYEFLKIYDEPLQEDTFLSNNIKRFYYYLKTHYKDKLKNETIYLIHRQIEGFERFIYHQYPNFNSISDISESHLIAFRDFCIDGLKNDKKTVNSKLTALRYFYKYLKYEELVPYNLTLNVAKLKTVDKKPTIIKTSDLKILFSQMRKRNYGIRDIGICKIILTTGLEIREVLKLKVEDLDLENDLLTIGNDVYPLGNEVSKDLKEYLIIRESMNVQGIPYVFLSQMGTPYSIRSFQMFFKKAITDTNIPLNISPRYLRTTFLYNMARVTKEDDLREITQQTQLKQYYRLLSNPLNNII